MWFKVNFEILKEIFIYFIVIKELLFVVCREGMLLLNNLGWGNRLLYIFLLIRDMVVFVFIKVLNLFFFIFNK